MMQVESQIIFFPTLNHIFNITRSLEDKLQTFSFNDNFFSQTNSASLSQID